jgi:nucleoid-associated protein YgaU
MQTITVAGGNLYRLALQYLGDSTQWNRIAQLNSLIDPMLTGIVMLQIPSVDPSAGGGIYVASSGNS